MEGCGTFARVEARQENLPCVSASTSFRSSNSLNLSLETINEAALGVSLGDSRSIRSNSRQMRPEMMDDAEKRGQLIRHLEDALTLADEIQDIQDI